MLPTSSETVCARSSRQTVIFTVCPGGVSRTRRRSSLAPSMLSPLYSIIASPFLIPAFAAGLSPLTSFTNAPYSSGSFSSFVLSASTSPMPIPIQPPPSRRARQFHSLCLRRTLLLRLQGNGLDCQSAPGQCRPRQKNTQSSTDRFPHVRYLRKIFDGLCSCRVSARMPHWCRAPQIVTNILEVFAEARVLQNLRGNSISASCCSSGCPSVFGWGP